VLVDVIGVVGRRQDFTLVDKIYLQRLEQLRLGDVAYAALGHDGNAHLGLDLLDHLRIAHARDTAIGANVRGDALQGHHGRGARVLCDLGLLGVGDVHYDAALDHLGQADLFLEGGHFHFEPPSRPDVNCSGFPRPGSRLRTRPCRRMQNRKTKAGSQPGQNLQSFVI